MPIAKANMGNGFSGVVGYVMIQKDVPQELQPKVIECNNVLQSSSNNIARQMRNNAQENGTKKPVMHMQISFHAEEKLTTDQAQKAIDSILKDVGINRDNHQFLIVEHFDKSHQHYHVVCNRVGLDNKLLNDSNIKIKLNIACDKAEKEQNLRPTEGRQWQFDIDKGEGKFVKVEKTKEQVQELPNDKREKVKGAKHDVQNKVIDVLQSAKTPQEFKEKLAEKGIEVRFSEDRTNNNAIRGASFRTDDIAVKGGDIGFKWNEISTILETNLNEDQNRKVDLPRQIVEPENEITPALAMPSNEDKPLKKRITVEEYLHNLSYKPLKEQLDSLNGTLLTAESAVRTSENALQDKLLPVEHKSILEVRNERIKDDISQIKAVLKAVEEKIQQDKPNSSLDQHLKVDMLGQIAMPFNEDKNDKLLIMPIEKEDPKDYSDWLEFIENKKIIQGKKEADGLVEKQKEPIQAPAIKVEPAEPKKTLLEIKIDQKKEELEEFSKKNIDKMDADNKVIDFYNYHIEQYINEINANQRNISGNDYKATSVCREQMQRISHRMSEIPSLKAHFNEISIKIDKVKGQIDINKREVNEKTQAYYKIQEQQPEPVKSNFIGLLLGEERKKSVRNGELEKLKASTILPTKITRVPLSFSDYVKQKMTIDESQTQKENTLKAEIKDLQQQVYIEQKPARDLAKKQKLEQEKERQTEMKVELTRLEERVAKKGQPDEGLQAKIDALKVMLPPQTKANPDGKLEILGNELEILKHKYLTIKDLDGETVHRKISMKIWVGQKETEYNEYKENVDEVKEQNKDLTNSQVDEIIQEREDNQRRRGLRL